MRNKIFTLVLACFVFPLFASAQPYEITEVDIFGLKKFLVSESITVYGISIESTVKEVLEKFGMTTSDLDYKNKYYFLDLKEGLKIRSSDKKSIEAIILFKEFEDNLKGETAKFFTLSTVDEFKNHLIKYFGKPDKHEPIRLMGQEFDTFYYANGFKFTRMFDREKITLSMQLTSMSQILKDMK